MTTTLPVTIILPTGAVIPGELSTDHPLSSYGRPVLLIEGKPYGLGDVFDPAWGDTVTVAETAVEGEDPDGTGLLDAWRGMCRAYLGRQVAYNHFAADASQLAPGETLETTEPVAWMTGAGTIRDDVSGSYAGDLEELAQEVRRQYQRLVQARGKAGAS